MGRHKLSYTAALIAVGLSDSSVSIVTALLVKRVLEAVKHRSMPELYQICIQFASVAVVLCIAVPIIQYLFGRSVHTIMMDVRHKLFHHMEKLPVSYYENRHSGDTISRMTNDFGMMESAFTGNIRSVVSLCVTGAGSAVVMYSLDWRFAAAMMGMGLLSAYLNGKFARPLRQISASIQSHSSALTERLSDQIAGAQVIRMFHMKDRVSRQYRGMNHLLAKLMMRRARTNAYMNGTNYGLRWVNSGGAFMLGAWMVMNGHIEFATLLAIILLLDNVSNLFSQFGMFWSGLQASLAGADRIFELMDAEAEPIRYDSHSSHTDNGAGAEEALELRNASFGYTEENLLLNSLNLKAERGCVIALAGPSGGGKSTVLKLLLGLYPLKQGELLMEGKSYSEFTLHELRDRIAYVSQDTYLFTGTIEENIRYGRPNASSDEIVAAARAANAHDFIMEQENGYLTLLGERGAKLSGGQKQRIAIARALLKDAPILLLDEATSALDSESEQAVQQGLQRLMEGKTTIAIAHRLSTIRQADKIYVIDRGTIVEQGRHADLLALNGVYRRLHDIQQRHEESLQKDAG